MLEPVPRIPSDKVMLLIDLKILVLCFDSTPKVTFPKALKPELHPPSTHAHMGQILAGPPAPEAA